MAETIYLEGIRVFPPNDNAPDFVKGAGVVSINKLVKFLKDHPEYMSDYKGEPQVKFQILEGKKGLYFTVDTYKKNSKETPPDVNNDDLPFQENDMKDIIGMLFFMLTSPIWITVFIIYSAVLIGKEFATTFMKWTMNI